MSKADAIDLTFRRHATKGFAWNYFYKLAEFGFMNLYVILVVRHFGPSISAPYAVFTALCTTISMVCGFAVDGVLLRHIQRISANSLSDSNELSNIESFGLRKFLKALFALRIVVVAVISSLIGIVVFLLPSIIPSFSETFGLMKGYLPYLIIFLFAQSITAFSTFSLVGLLETKRLFIASVFSRGFLAASGFLLLSQGLLSLPNAISLYVGSSCLNAGFLVLALQKELAKHAPVSRKESRARFHSFVREILVMVWHPKKLKLFLATPLMVYGIITWGSDMLSTILGRQPDILMMRIILGEYSPQIGYYLSASILLLVTEYIFLFGLGGTLVSIFSKLAHDDEKDNLGIYPRLSRARKEIAGFQNVVLLPLCIYMMVFAPRVIQSIYGYHYDEAIPMIRIGLVALAIAVGIFGGGMQVTSLVAIRKERLVFRNRLFWGITNILVNIFLIKYYGGLGAIVGTQFSNTFSCGAEAFFTRQHIGKSLDIIGLLRIIFISSLSVTAAYFLTTFIISNGPPMIYVLVSGLLMVSSVFLLYYIFRVPEAGKVWQRLRSFYQQNNSAVFVP
jgi:O-antigen/teichoic acid export membrane protein